jgi:hypothetical protein
MAVDNVQEIDHSSSVYPSMYKTMFHDQRRQLPELSYCFNIW